MTTYLTNRDGGKTNEDGHIRFFIKHFRGQVVEGLTPQAKSPLSMGIDITVGDAKVNYGSYGYTVWTDATESVSITTADPSNPRWDRVVGYIDRSITPSTANTNNPGLFKFMAIAGTPAASPVSPSDVVTQAAVGADNPFFDICLVYVGAGVTTISGTEINDIRYFTSITMDEIQERSLDNGVTIDNLNIKDGLITGGSGTGVANSSLSTTAGDIGGAAGTWVAVNTGFSVEPTGGIYRYQKIGKFVTLHIVQPVNGTSNSTSFAISLPFTAKTIANMQWHGTGTGLDNSLLIATPVFLRIASGGSVVNVYPSASSSSAWTASNGKRLPIGDITYEIE